LGLVSLGATFLSTFVEIGQNRRSAFQQAKADHDFHEEETERKVDTEVTRSVHAMTQEIDAFVEGVRPPTGDVPPAGA
jgi:hypothetical protein